MDRSDFVAKWQIRLLFSSANQSPYLVNQREFVRVLEYQVSREFILQIVEFEYFKVNMRKVSKMSYKTPYMGVKKQNQVGRG